MTAGFQTIPDGPVRAIVVGAGDMGREWIRVVTESADVVLAGVVDIDIAAARRAAAFDPGVHAGSSLADAVVACGAQVVIDVTYPAAHLPVTLDALSLGLPVLGEKPLAADLPAALVLIAAADVAGQLFMVSQSRRYNPQLVSLKARASAVGPVGIATAHFFKAPRFGGFRDEMAHPLLVDMAIHQFDMARFLLDADPIAVYCEEFNPSWSWYAGAAAASAVFEMTEGRRFSYTGSWCSPGAETSWNGAWRLSGAAGSVVWDGDSEPSADGSEPAHRRAVEHAPVPEGIAGALAEFVRALRSGLPPTGDARQNLGSLAMVEAAVQSAETGRRVLVAELLDSALTAAKQLATGRVREALSTFSQ